MSNRVKKYQEQLHQVALKELQSKKNTVLIIRQLYKDSFKIETETIEELDQYLKDRTSFPDSEFSAAALGLKKQYKLLVEMSKGINLKDFDDKGNPLKSILKDLKDKYTQYYTDSEITELDAIQLVVDAINKLDRNDANAIMFNTVHNKFVYREQMAQTNKQFSKIR